MYDETGPVLEQNPVNEPGVFVIHDPESPEWHECEAIESEVFIEKQYVEKPEELREEYAKYTSNTEFVLVRGDSGAPVGSMRAITYQPDVGIKTIDDIQSGRLEVSPEGSAALSSIAPTDMLEVGTLAVKREHRSTPEDEGRVAIQLYGAIYGETLKHNRNFVIASFDEDYYDRFKGIFGDGCFALGPATDYMGSKTVPAVLDMTKLYTHMQATAPSAFDAIVKVADNMR